MQLQFSRSLWAAFIAFTAITFTSCGDNISKQALIIPNDAHIVMTTNLSKMALKSDVVEFQETKIYKSFEQQLQAALLMVDDKTRNAVNGAIEDPLVLGIDFLEDMYMFTNAPELGDGEIVYVGFSFKMADQTRLETFLGNMPEIAEIKEGAGFKYVHPDDEVILVWTEELGLLLTIPNYSYRENALAYAEGLMALNETKSYLQNPKFTEFVNETKDVGIFYNWTSLTEIMPYYMREDKESLDLVTDNYSVLTANFTNDKISVHLDNVLSEGFKTRFDIMSGDGVPSDYKNCLTDNGMLIGFASAALNVEGLIKVTENEGDLSEGLDRLARELSMESADLNSLFTGDLAFSFMDMTEKEVTLNFGEYGLEETDFDVELATHKIPVMKAIAIVGINDKANVSKALEKIGAKRNGDVYSLYDNYFTVLDDKVIWSSYEEIAAKMAKDGELGVLKNGYEDILSENPLSAFLSLDYDGYPPMIREMMEMSMSRSDRKSFKAFMSKFNGVVFKSNWISSDLELMMSNTSQNALKTLLHTVDEAM